MLVSRRVQLSVIKAAVHMCSQARDLRVAKTGRDLEADRRSAVFQQPWVQEAVLQYMQRKLGAGQQQGS